MTIQGFVGRVVALVVAILLVAGALLWRAQDEETPAEDATTPVSEVTTSDPPVGGEG